jgi:hypothetical protein
VDPALVRRLREILAVPGDRVGKARRITAAIRETYGYPWVGIRSGSGEVVAWSGPTPSATRSRMGTSILDGAAARVGSLDVESDLPDAFSAEDRECLTECARLLAPLWG